MSKKSLLDDVRGVLGDDREPVNNDDWLRQLTSSKQTYLWLLGLSFFSTLFFVLGLANPNEDEGGMIAFLSFVVGAPSIAALLFLWKQREKYAAADHEERLHQRELERMMTASRAAYLQTLSNIEIAALQSAGQLTEADRWFLEQEGLRRERNWQSRENQHNRRHQASESRNDRIHQERESAEARRHERQMATLRNQLDTAAGREVRNWQAQENALDRQATIEQMLTRFEGKLKEMEVRLEYESPSAHRRTEEQTIIMRACLSMMREINNLPNKTPEDRTFRKQAFDQFKTLWKA